jgi:hypothetical protein
MYFNVVGLGSHAKGRAHTGGMGIGRKYKKKEIIMNLIITVKRGF